MVCSIMQPNRPPEFYQHFRHKELDCHVTLRDCKLCGSWLLHTSALRAVLDLDARQCTGSEIDSAVEEGRLLSWESESRLRRTRAFGRLPNISRSDRVPHPRSLVRFIREVGLKTKVF